MTNEWLLSVNVCVRYINEDKIVLSYDSTEEINRVDNDLSYTYRREIKKVDTIPNAKFSIKISEKQEILVNSESLEDPKKWYVLLNSILMDRDKLLISQGIIGLIEGTGVIKDCRLAIEENSTYVTFAKEGTPFYNTCLINFKGKLSTLGSKKPVSRNFKPGYIYRICNKRITNRYFIYLGKGSINGEVNTTIHFCYRIDSDNNQFTKLRDVTDLMVKYDIRGSDKSIEQVQGFGNVVYCTKMKLSHEVGNIDIKNLNLDNLTNSIIDKLLLTDENNSYEGHSATRLAHLIDILEIRRASNLGTITTERSEILSNSLKNLIHDNIIYYAIRKHTVNSDNGNSRDPLSILDRDAFKTETLSKKISFGLNYRTISNSLAISLMDTRKGEVKDVFYNCGIPIDKIIDAVWDKAISNIQDTQWVNNIDNYLKYYYNESNSIFDVRIFRSSDIWLGTKNDKQRFETFYFNDAQQFISNVLNTTHDATVIQLLAKCLCNTEYGTTHTYNGYRNNRNAKKTSRYIKVLDFWKYCNDPKIQKIPDNVKEKVKNFIITSSFSELTVVFDGSKPIGSQLEKLLTK